MIIRNLKMNEWLQQMYEYISENITRGRKDVVFGKYKYSLNIVYSLTKEIFILKTLCWGCTEA